MKPSHVEPFATASFPLSLNRLPLIQTTSRPLSPFKASNDCLACLWRHGRFIPGDDSNGTGQQDREGVARNDETLRETIPRIR